MGKGGPPGLLAEVAPWEGSSGVTVRWSLSSHFPGEAAGTLGLGDLPGQSVRWKFGPRSAVLGGVGAGTDAPPVWLLGGHAFGFQGLGTPLPSGCLQACLIGSQ